MTNGRAAAAGVTAFFILGYMVDGLDWSFILVGGLACIMTAFYWVGVLWDAVKGKKQHD